MQPGRLQTVLNLAAVTSLFDPTVGSLVCTHPRARTLVCLQPSGDRHFVSIGTMLSLSLSLSLFPLSLFLSLPLFSHSSASEQCRLDVLILTPGSRGAARGPGPRCCRPLREPLTVGFCAKHCAKAGSPLCAKQGAGPQRERGGALCSSRPLCRLLRGHLACDEVTKWSSRSRQRRQEF